MRAGARCRSTATALLGDLIFLPALLSRFARPRDRRVAAEAAGAR